MNTTILTRPDGSTFDLTDEDAASSYGVPVLVVDGAAYGPADSLGNGWTAGELVELYLRLARRREGRLARLTPEGADAARRFLASNPGPAPVQRYAR